MTASVDARILAGSVEVTSPVPLRGVVTPAADGFLVHAGLVVTLPLPQDLAALRWDLAAGQAGRLPCVVGLVPCAPSREQLSPGRYELYARVVFTPDGGPAEESFGGAWPLELR